MSPSVSPAGDISLTGKLHYRNLPNEPVMKAISLDGQLGSEVLRAVASGRRVELRKLQGSYRLADGNLVVPNVSLQAFGGSLTASAEMKHLDTTPESTVHAALNGISLRAIQQMGGEQATRQAALSGTLSGKTDAAWKGSVSNLRAQSDLVIRAEASSRSNPSARDVPVDGTSALLLRRPPAKHFGARYALQTSLCYSYCSRRHQRSLQPADSGRSHRSAPVGITGRFLPFESEHSTRQCPAPQL